MYFIGFRGLNLVSARPYHCGGDDGEQCTLLIKKSIHVCICCPSEGTPAGLRPPPHLTGGVMSSQGPAPRGSLGPVIRQQSLPNAPLCYTLLHGPASDQRPRVQSVGLQRPPPGPPLAQETAPLGGGERNGGPRLTKEDPISSFVIVVLVIIEYKIKKIPFTFTFRAFSRRFYPKRLTISPSVRRNINNNIPLWVQ